MKKLLIMLAATFMLCACQADADYMAPSSATFSGLQQGSNQPSPIAAECFSLEGVAAVSYTNLLVSTDFDWLRSQTTFYNGGDYDNPTPIETEPQGTGLCAKLTLHTQQAYTNLLLSKFRITLGGNTYDYLHHTGIYDTASNRWITTPAPSFNTRFNLSANRTYEIYIVGGVNGDSQGQFLDAGECQPTPFFYATPLGHFGGGWYNIGSSW